MGFDGFDGEDVSAQTLTVRGVSTLTGAVTASGGVVGNVTGNLTGAVTATTIDQSGKFVQTSVARGADAYAYGMRLTSGEAFFVGGAATKSYLLQVDGDRPSGSAATGDSNDALIRASGNNYAANDANFIFRGVNASINNRSGGVLGRMDHNLGVQNKSGGTVTTLIGLTVTAENYGDLTGTDVFGGIDVVLKNEAAVAATEFGLRLRNENNSIADAVGAAILVTDTGANTGWDILIDASGTALTAAAFAFADDSTTADATGGTMGSIVSGAFIRVKVGSTYMKIPLHADS